MLLSLYKIILQRINCILQDKKKLYQIFFSVLNIARTFFTSLSSSGKNAVLLLIFMVGKTQQYLHNLATDGNMMQSLTDIQLAQVSVVIAMLQMYTTFSESQNVLPLFTQHYRCKMCFSARFAINYFKNSVLLKKYVL